MDQIKQIEITNYEALVSRQRIGVVVLKYGLLTIRCDVVLHVRDNKLWVRMPQIWKTSDRKIRLCEWESQEVSDQVQKHVLECLRARYGVTVQTARIDWDCKKKRPQR